MTRHIDNPATTAFSAIRLPVYDSVVKDLGTPPGFTPEDLETPEAWPAHHPEPDQKDPHTQ